MFCPLPIKKYTEYMGGVDIFDHYRASYPFGRKSKKKNWHRLLWFLIEAALINSYIIYMLGHSKRRNTHREFRLRVGRALIDNFTSRKKSAPIFKTKKGGINVPHEIRVSNVGVHMPELSKFRRCRFCSTRAAERRSKYICSTCKVPLCAAPCFSRFHNFDSI